MGRLEALSSANAEQTLAYLAHRPYDNVYVGWMIAAGRLDRGAEVTVWRDDDERIAGACYYGSQIVPCADGNDAIDAFAGVAKRVRLPRMIVGPRAAVERMREGTRGALPQPSAIRTSQPVYALDRSALRLRRDGASVARASLAELVEIVPNSAAMIAGEVGGDPRNLSADMRTRTARIIESGWWWRYRVDGALAFMCNVGSTAFGTAQLQGVWTPPALRGHGYAARGLGAICDHLLDEYATLCLYVNDFNAPAIALYERVGFTRAGEFQTVLFR